MVLLLIVGGVWIFVGLLVQCHFANLMYKQFKTVFILIHKLRFKLRT